MSKTSRYGNKLQKQTLAEQVALTLEEAILDGEWQPGEALPTEPELAESFGVSRAVIRDATRMLAARGLVQAQHGRGVFVTASQNEAFGEAFLLALRRSDATVWDVEQFEQMVFPRVCAMASTAAAEEDLAAIKSLGEAYIAAFTKTTATYWQIEANTPAAEIEANRAAFIAFIRAIFIATHNKVWQLLASPILHLRSVRHWEDRAIEVEQMIASETQFVETLISAVASRDPLLAQKTVAQLMVLPPEAEQAMRNTPVGEIPHIPISMAGENE
jgi:GntR family transcriptional regulator, transcriptional repressor for pyruvate dehydrogenase complex